jgi:ElaB/YqjD/DUF883 family membrane-anchored ribosome-binding protein
MTKKKRAARAQTKKDLENLKKDLENTHTKIKAFVKKHPDQAAAIALGIGAALGAMASSLKKKK